MPYANPEDQRRAARAHYQANKDLYKQRAQDHKTREQEKIRSYIRQVKDRPCADCKIKYPYYVMQFDHLGKKSFTVGDYMRHGACLRTIQAEIMKCEVVCANCHAERTHQRSIAAPAGLEPAYPD